MKLLMTGNDCVVILPNEPLPLFRNEKQCLLEFVKFNLFGCIGVLNGLVFYVRHFYAFNKIKYLWGNTTMTVARVTEISASSPESFEEAVRVGVERASKTLKNITGAWVKDQEVGIEDGRVTDFRVKMKITFVLE